jgi:hypothetical protein
MPTEFLPDFFDQIFAFLYIVQGAFVAGPVKSFRKIVKHINRGEAVLKPNELDQAGIIRIGLLGVNWSQENNTSTAKRVDAILKLVFWKSHLRCNAMRTSESNLHQIQFRIPNRFFAIFRTIIILSEFRQKVKFLNGIEAGYSIIRNLIFTIQQVTIIQIWLNYHLTDDAIS